MATKISFSPDAAKRISRVIRDAEHAPVNRSCGMSSRHRSAGGSSRGHYDVFPAIPAVVTDIELGEMYWHACDPDTVWTLDSFVFTAATGVVGTDENGDTP